jgi:hypothetical protein
MPGPNRTIIAATIIIMVAGIYHYFLQSANKSTTLTRILVGGYMLAFFASLLDLIGFGVGQVAGWILMLAVAASVYSVINDLASRNAARTSSSAAATNAHTAQA